MGDIGLFGRETLFGLKARSQIKYDSGIEKVYKINHNVYLEQLFTWLLRWGDKWLCLLFLQILHFHLRIHDVVWLVVL